MSFTYIYLHGFASGPSSSKASYFRRQFADRGITLETPALDEGRFEQMTITSQLDVIRRLANGRPSRLIGSSLGGWLASLYAAQHPEVDSLVLLAPAFGFVSLLPGLIGPEAIQTWEQTGRLAVFHYSDNEEKWLRHDILEDGKRYDPFPSVEQRTLILHGRHDDSVPLANSARFVAERRNRRLVEVETDHQMTDSLDRLWAETAVFFGLD